MAMPEEYLDAAEALIASEMNGGESAPEPAAVEAPAGDTPDAPEQPRDPVTGQFVAKDDNGEVVPEPAEETDATDEGMPEAPEAKDDTPEKQEGSATEEEQDDVIVLEVDDPEVLTFLEKYDGDVLKALKAAQEAQSLIGRQGQELGDTRKSETEARSEVEQLRQELQEFQQSLTRQAQYAGIDWQEQIDENPVQAFWMADEAQNQAAALAAFEAVKEASPYDAFQIQQAVIQRAEEMEAQQAPPEAPTTDLASEVGTLKQRFPDIQERLPEIEKVLAEKPYLVRELQEGTPQSRASALEDAYLLARSRSNEAETSESAKRIILRAKVQADAAKADAAVLSASKSSAAEVSPAPNERLQQALGAILGDEDFVIV